MKRKNYLKFIVAGIILMTTITGFNIAAKWSLKKNEDSIKIYTREAANTSLKQVKVNFTVHSTPDKITHTVLDIKNHNVWMDKVKEAKILKTISEDEFYIYYEFESPWPTSNRDIVNHTKIFRDSNHQITKITSKSAPNFIPEKDGVVRITLSEGSWVFTSAENGTIEVNHILLASPGGGVPEWVINMFIVDQPFVSHRKLKKYLEKN